MSNSHVPESMRKSTATKNTINQLMNMGSDSESSEQEIQVTKTVVKAKAMAKESSEEEPIAVVKHVVKAKASAFTPTPADNEALPSQYKCDLEAKYNEAADKESRRWGFDKLLCKIGGIYSRWAVNIIGVILTIQFLAAFLVMGHWSGAAGYTFFLTLAPMCMWFILLISDVDMSLNFQRREQYMQNARKDSSQPEETEHRVLVEMAEVTRERAYCIRKSLAYVYLCSVFASFMFGIFGSWGMGQKFWGNHCQLPRGCDRDHTAFIIFIVVRVFFQFHVFWVLLCHAANIAQAQKCYNCGHQGPFKADCPFVVEPEEEEEEVLLPVAKTIIKTEAHVPAPACLFGQFSIKVIEAKIKDAHSNSEFGDDVVSACIIREQTEAGMEAKVHVSETQEGKNPQYNWKCDVQITNCEEPITIEIGSFGEVIGKENIFACKWRDGEHRKTDLVPIRMGHGDVTVYVQAEWIGDDQEMYGRVAVTAKDVNANTFKRGSTSNSMSTWDKLSHTKKE